MAKIWVYAELAHDGSVEKTSLEILTKARSLDGNTLEAVALGTGATAAAGILGEHGATTVYASDEKVFTDCIAIPGALALAALVGEHKPDLILFPFTYDSRDVASRLGAKLGSTVMSNVSDILAADSLQAAPWGTLVVDVTLGGPTPKIGLVRPKSFEAVPAGGGAANVVAVSVDIPEDARKAVRVERVEEEQSGPKLEEAPVVVAGGRGLGKVDNVKLLEALAGQIQGAAVGATRAIVDAGWVPYAMQIGQTGKTVKPKVYLAFGISGATQHIVGMKSSDRIIAVNKDPEAPIFQISDLGIVGDALKVLPQLAEEVKSRKG